jgi:predicted extracellular nuclease
VTGFAAPTAGLAALLLIGIASVRPVPRDTTISSIQGRSHLSPVVRARVRTTGIVTGRTGHGLYLQDPAGDDDPSTSDGIVAIGAASGPAVGDLVRVEGVVTEAVPGGPGTANLSLTMIDSAVVEIISRGHPLPVAVVLGRHGRRLLPAVISRDELPVNLRDPARVAMNRFDPQQDAIDFFESLEFMRVAIIAPVVVGATQTFSAAQSELVVVPDSGGGLAPARRSRAGGLMLQSGALNEGSQNPERVQVQFDAELYPTAPPPARIGDRLGTVTGILRYDFGNYEVAATAAVTLEPSGLQPETTALAGDSERLAVATYNVLNLSPVAADSVQRRLLGQQIAERLRSPDILALQEIQDESGEADDGITSARGTLRALAGAIRAAGGARYEFISVAPEDGRPGGAPGGNIRNAFLYRPDRVRLESFRSLTLRELAVAGIADSAAFRGSRDPLEAVFRFRGRRYTIVNNHLTSRYGSTPVFGATQPFVQAGERERAAQARALHDYAAALLARDRAARLLVVGDMNTFEFSDELHLRLAGRPVILYALAPLLPESDRYSYNYEGNSQTLDHVFVSDVLRAGAEVDIVHLNADFPARPGETASDHDPVVARLR